MLKVIARIILTDSGGMQKEAYFFGVPCVTMRTETEWVELVEIGWNVVVGADYKKIVDAASSFKPPVQRLELYGDGLVTGIPTATNFCNLFSGIFS